MVDCAAVYAQSGDPASRLISGDIIIAAVQRSWNCKTSRLVNRSLEMHVLYRREERQNGEKWDREESRGETRNKDERENMLTCNALVQLRKSKQSNQRRRKRRRRKKSTRKRTNAEKKNRTRIRIRIIRMDNKQTLLRLKVEKKKVYNNK